MGCGGSSAQAVESPVRAVESPKPPKPRLAQNYFGRGTKKLDLVTGGNQDLLKTTLETCLSAFVEPEVEITKSSVGMLVEEVFQRAMTIISECAGKGPHGKCPFSSAYEVHIFYKFSLSYLGIWSEHQLGKDEDEDAAFYSQLNMLCETLITLDPSAVFLPQEISENIQGLMREAFWPNWFTGEKKKGEAEAMRCIAIGKEWNLEESKAYQDALTTIEGSTRSGSESESNAHF